MRFLVTGASGFIGYALVRHLTDVFGASSVQALCAPLARHSLEEERKRCLMRSSVATLETDLLDDHPDLSAVRPFDVLFHLAAFTETESDDAQVRVNDLGTERLLFALQPLLSGTLVVLTSSLAAVDRSGPTDDRPQTEEHPCSPRTPYGSTKLAAEQIVRAQAERMGFEWTIVRLPTVVGPGFRPQGMFSLVEKGLRRNALSTRLDWPGRISLAFLDDVVVTLRLLAMEPHARNQLFHLSAPEAPTFGDLTQKIADVLGIHRRPLVLPRGIWTVVRRLVWAPGLQRLLPFSLRIAAWRISHIVTDGMVGNGTKLEGVVPMQYTDLSQALRCTYGVEEGRFSAADSDVTCSVIVPCRNERGNIEPAVRRIPTMGRDMEILFVEGNSDDGTLEECHRVQQIYPHRNIRVLTQDGTGKGDAVRKGFAHAQNDLLFILDADLTVRPEDLTRFFGAAVSGKGDLINGTRLLRPMPKGAMRFLNYIANHLFARILTRLLSQHLTDTLCGTKVIWREAYERLRESGEALGEADPFGDFELLHGAATLGLTIYEVPVDYGARTYGSPQIRRFRDGWKLLRLANQIRSARHRTDRGDTISPAAPSATRQGKGGTHVV